MNELLPFALYQELHTGFIEVQHLAYSLPVFLPRLIVAAE
jgi:hypothetical protein